MERNRNGYPTPRTADTENGGNAEMTCPMPDGGCGGEGGTMMDDLLLAYAYVPIQKWRKLHSVDEALERGTMFEELDKPKEVYGYEW